MTFDQTIASLSICVKSQCCLTLISPSQGIELFDRVKFWIESMNFDFLIETLKIPKQFSEQSMLMKQPIDKQIVKESWNERKWKLSILILSSYLSCIQ